jgi:hypothetical protein
MEEHDGVAEFAAQQGVIKYRMGLRSFACNYLRHKILLAKLILTVRPMGSTLIWRQAPLSISRWQRIGPVVTLLLLAPVVSEVLYGATRLSVIFVLIPEILTWGCAALLIREVIRRWNKGWRSMLLLAIALAIAEEWIIQQTSIAPMVGLTKRAYGRVWGVNWVYLLWALGYESVWVVLIPVKLTELLFPQRGGEKWLRTRGLVITSITFLMGACMAWYGWTQRARVLVFHMPLYRPPTLYIALAFVVIVLLVAAAHSLPTLPRQEGGAPSDGSVLLVTTILGIPWAAFVLVGYGSFPEVPLGVSLAVGCAWCFVALGVMHRWSCLDGWGDRHRFAVVFGGVLGCIVSGFVVFKVGGALRIHWIGKAVLNAIAFVWLVLVGLRTARRSTI